MSATPPLHENATVSEILPSYYWPQNAVIIVTECGHKHARPITMKIAIGDSFACPFCEEPSALDTQKEKTR